MNGKIYNLINSDKNELAVYIENQMYLINELQRQLESQIELNRNLIRISKDRYKQENRIKSEESGFIIQKWNKVNYKIEKGGIIKCYKLKIKTPYSAAAFNEDDVVLLQEKDRTILEEVIGKINYIEYEYQIKDNIRNNPEINWFWGIEYEGDIEHGNCIVMYVYSSLRPIIYHC